MEVEVLVATVEIEVNVKLPTPHLLSEEFMGHEPKLVP